jgi:hypothetical protein
MTSADQLDDARTHARSTDDQLPGPPNLDDKVESLRYWHQRSEDLPWYRIRARREAARMTVRWEQRVGAAVASEHDAPLPSRLAAGALVVRTRLARWSRRAGIALLATVIAVVIPITVATVVAAVFLLHVL